MPAPAPAGQQTHNAMQPNSDLMVQILQWLDIIDKKLGQFEHIKASVNAIATRMNSVDQKITSLESKIKDIGRDCGPGERDNISVQQ